MNYKITDKSEFVNTLKKEREVIYKDFLIEVTGDGYMVRLSRKCEPLRTIAYEDFNEIGVTNIWNWINKQ